MPFDFDSVQLPKMTRDYCLEAVCEENGTVKIAGRKTYASSWGTIILDRDQAIKLARFLADVYLEPPQIAKQDNEKWVTFPNGEKTITSLKPVKITPVPSPDKSVNHKPESGWFRRALQNPYGR